MIKLQGQCGPQVQPDRGQEIGQGRPGVQEENQEAIRIHQGRPEHPSCPRPTGVT